MSENPEIVMQAKHIVKQFPASHGRTLTACNDINLTMYKGRTLGIVGESGCGKSTFVRMVISLDQPTSGEILYHGKNITGLSKKETWENRQNLQMVFQDPLASFNPKMKIGDILTEPLMNYKKIKRSERNAKARELLRMVELPEDFVDRYPHNMSGGQRQRIGIARALAANPEFIVCDEPISALDVSIQAQVINILEELQDKYSFTYLFISHDLSMVRHISHQVGVMYLGNLIEYAQVDALYENMLHPYTSCLMSAVPIADPEQNRRSHRIILQGDVPSPIDPPSGCPFRTRCSQCKEICKEKKPELKRINEKHMVACHLYD